MDRASKSPGLVALVDRLRSDLGQDYFIEAPHWDGDSTAIGLGQPGDPRFLIYLSVQPDGSEVNVECEVPAEDGAAGMPYDVVGSGHYADYEQILGVVRDHLAR
jgi:hypothetical protein